MEPNARGTLHRLLLLITTVGLSACTALAATGTRPANSTTSSAIELDHEFDSGSRIRIDQLSPVQIENLVLLGKVWGFLKYYHPAVTGGRHHWDYDLFRVLPDILAAGSRPGATRVLNRWVVDLGPVDPPPPVSANGAATALPPPTEWTKDESQLGKPLSERLRSIGGLRPTTDDQFYVYPVPHIRCAHFRNEPYYNSPAQHDAGFRLLAVYRFWNMVAYWFPYRDVMGENWDAVLAEFIPRVVLTPTFEEYERALMALVARIHDSHANLWSSLEVRPPVGNGMCPGQFRLIGEGAVVTKTPAGIPSIQPGDVVTALDKVPLRELIHPWLPYYGNSNEAARDRDFSRCFTRGPLTRPATLTLRRNERTFDVEVPREKENLDDVFAFHDRAGPTFCKISPEVAYIKLSDVKVEDVDDYLDQAVGTRGLVIDIRNYPSAFVPFALGRRLVEKAVPCVIFTKPDYRRPGAFLWTEAVVLRPEGKRYTGKVAILVDEVTQSSAEYTAMILRAAPGAVVVGSQTAGADGNCVDVPLPGNGAAMFSGIGVFYPDRKPTQRIGIVPDILARPTPAGIRAGRDEVLEAALRHILGAPPVR
jgi:hypothetical protein